MMLRADKVIPAGQWAGAPADTVVLDFDERYRRRFAMTGVSGLEFLLDLAEAAMLRGGDGLGLEDGRVVEVVAAPEPLAEIRAADALALVRVAWHLGNRHLPTELLPKALRIRRDPVIEAMAEGLGARIVPLEAPFNPEGGAYVKSETSVATPHDHDHHHHDHRHGYAHDRDHKPRHDDRHHHDHDHGPAHAHDDRHGRDHGRDRAEADGGSLLPLLIWLSPGFPVGAFAYSHGLEWAVEAGDIVDARSLEGWLIDLVEFGAPRSDAVLFSVAFHCAASADWPALMEANVLAVALAASAERRLETTAQGAAFIAAARAAWDCQPLRRLEQAPDGRIAYPIAVAAAASGHGLPLEASLQAFALAQAANLVSAAVRLGPIGQTDGQKILAALLPRIRRFGARGRLREPRRSRRRGVSFRHCRHASRKPVFEAVPVMTTHQPLRVGIGGPVGSGKTALMEKLCKRLRDELDIAAITNDIYTKEDARILVEAGALAPERIIGVETGGCPHTAIREDASINLAAVAEMRKRFANLDLILIEFGGDNLAATFSPELADITIYVIDVSGGEKIPRKGGPGVARSDLLVINKIDLAPYVGASLEVMARDAAAMRKSRPFVMANMKSGEGLDAIVAFLRDKGGLKAA